MKSKKYLALPLILTFVALGTTNVSADEGEEAGSFSANVTLTTNYMYRGVTQTSDGPAIQGGFDYEHGPFYVGTWASSLDFDDGSGSGIEIDYYAGWAPSMNGVDLDFGVLYYTYPDSRDDLAEQDFLELYAGAGTSIGEKVSVSVKVSYSPDFYLESGGAWYPEISLGVAITDNLSADIHAGFQSFEDSLQDDYTDYNLGLTYSCDWADFDLRYFDTSDRIGGSADDVFVFSISRSF